MPMLSGVEDGEDEMEELENKLKQLNLPEKVNKAMKLSQYGIQAY